MADEEDTDFSGVTEAEEPIGLLFDGTAATPEGDATLPDFLLLPRANAFDRAPDQLRDRFHLRLNSPLEYLSTPMARAFEAFDDDGEFANLYALVCVNTLPYRYKSIAACLDIRHSALTVCRAAGPIRLSNPPETRLVLFFDKPKGKTLADLMKRNGGGFNEAFVTERILKPLNEVIGELARFNVHHGSLNPTTLYFEETLTVAECLSTPTGYTQDYHFEPIERLMSQPTGKGSTESSADCYALGVLALNLLYGKLPTNDLTQIELIEKLLKLGSYHALTGNLAIPDAFEDLLRGTLNDNKRERWTTQQIGNWLGGKRFNLIPPSVPREATRSFLFMEKDFLNRKGVANAFYLHWDEAIRRMPGEKIVRWLEQNPADTDAAGLMAKTLHVTDDKTSKKREIRDEDLAKAIAILDPSGPLRYRNLAVNIEGLGTMMANVVREKDNPQLQTMLLLISGALPTYINSLSQRAENMEAVNTVWKLQRVKMILRILGPGFGMERVLYDLNDSLPCQSPLIHAYHAMTMKEVLRALDHIAKDQLRKVSLVDRHLAAFVASRLELNKELRVERLSDFPDLAKDPQLVMLRLLDEAQRSCGLSSLKGLTMWMATTITPVIGKIHRKSTRESVLRDLKRAANSGKLSTLMKVICDEAMIGKDSAEYARALNLQRYHTECVNSFLDDNTLERRARFLGRQVSVFLGGTALLMTIFWTLSPYVNI